MKYRGVVTTAAFVTLPIVTFGAGFVFYMKSYSSLPNRVRWSSDLSHQTFVNVNAERMEATRVTMSHADLSRAFISLSDFTDVSFISAKFNQTRATGCQFYRVQFRNATLRNASLLKSVFADVDFHAADLRGVNLRQAQFYGVDLREANLEGASITGLVYDSRTKWPDGFDPDKYDAIKLYNVEKPPLRVSNGMR